MHDAVAESSPRAAAAHPAPISLRTLWPWLLLAGAVLLALLYLVGVEEGATSLTSGTFLHELMHDGRHVLGSPCH